MKYGIDPNIDKIDQIHTPITVTKKPIQTALIICIEDLRDQSWPFAGVPILVQC